MKNVHQWLVKLASKKLGLGVLSLASRRIGIAYVFKNFNDTRATPEDSSE